MGRAIGWMDARFNHGTHKRLKGTATMAARVSHSIGKAIQATSSAYGMGRKGNRPRNRFQAKPTA